MDEIESLFDDNEIKYIKQFKISTEAEKLDKDEKNTYKNSLLKSYKLEFENKILLGLSNLVSLILKGDLNISDKNFLNYYNNLIFYSKNSNVDAFSKLKIFKENNINNLNIDSEIEDINKILKNLNELTFDKINKKEYYEIFKKYIKSNDMDKLKEDFLDLSKKKKLKKEINILVNETLNSIQNKLNEFSNIKRPNDLNFINYSKEFYLKNKFNNFLREIDYLELDKEEFGEKFLILKTVSKFKNSSEIKKYLSDKIKRSKIFDNFFSEGDFYNFILEQNKIKDFDKSNLFKTILKLDIKLQKKNGDELSGGEKAEFYLLKEIDDSKKFDVLLLDEPESSFDNLFLSENVSKMINDLKDKTVLLSTHNNVLVDSFNNDWLIVCEKYEDNEILKRRYFNFEGEKELYDINNDSINTYKSKINMLEAGEEKYKNRGEKYENIKNR